MTRAQTNEQQIETKPQKPTFVRGFLATIIAWTKGTP
jgi:hypothetical protein